MRPTRCRGRPRSPRTVTLPEGSAVNRARMVAVPPSLTVRDVFSTSSAAAAGAGVVSVMLMVTMTEPLTPPPEGVRVTLPESSARSLSRTVRTANVCQVLQFDPREGPADR